MPQQTKVSISPKDIARIGIQCPNCSLQIQIALADEFSGEDLLDSPRCILCSYTWPQDLEKAKVINFINQLKAFANYSPGAALVRLELSPSDE